MTTTRDIVIYAGEAFTLSLPYAGTAGRGQRTHIRTADATATVVQILTHNGDANARVIYNDSTQTMDYTIGASQSAAWIVNANRVEWVFDTEDYDLSDVDDVVIPFRGKVIVYGNRTRESDVTPSDQMPSGDGRYVRFDGVQGLSAGQQLQARENIGAGTGGGGGSGDVVGPASATDDRIAAFDGTTGKLIKQGTVTATAVASHIGSTSNPHSVTAAQAGADPAGTAAGAVSTHNAVTTAHGISAFGVTLVDDADAATARTTLGLGTAATSASGDFAAASHAHAASAITSGALVHERGGLEADVSAYSGLVKIAAGATSAVTVTAAGEALLDDADASVQRTTLGLGGAATLSVGTTAGTVAAGDDSRLSDARTPTAHNQDASTITTGTLDAARLPAPGTTTLGGVKRNTGSAGQFVTGVDTDGSLLRDTPVGGGTPAGSGTELQYRDGSTFGAMAGTAWNNTTLALTVTGATLTASAPILNLTQTWNNAAVTFTGVKVNVTNTASAAASMLLNLQLGGASAFKVLRTGAITLGTAQYNGMSFGTGGEFNLDTLGTITFKAHSTGVMVPGACYLAFNSTSLAANGTGTPDVILARDAAGVLAQRNAANAQTKRIYGTYTDASNYVRASLAATSTAVTLAAETAGTGADNVPVILTPAGTSQVEVGNGVQFTEMTAPSAPAANKVILFAQDNGAGKTQLMALFPSGAAQQVSIEP